MFQNPFKNNKTADVSYTKDTSQITQKAQKWGQKKFIPKSTKPAIMEKATGWVSFKSQLIEKDKETRSANAVNMESHEAKQFLKKREENYRKMLITEKCKEPTIWDDFGGEETELPVPTTHKPQKKKIKKDSQKQNVKFQAHNNKTHHKQLNKDEQPLFVDKDLLKNFDSKQLTPQQNNTLRKVITATTMMAKNNKLNNAVKDLKNKKFRKSNINA